MNYELDHLKTKIIRFPIFRHHKMSESSDEDCLTPPEILQEAMAITSNLLPQKSKKKYEKLYEQFMDWKVKQNITSFNK